MIEALEDLPLVCPRCGKTGRSRARFCKQCGASLTGFEDVQAPPPSTLAPVSRNAVRRADAQRLAWFFGLLLSSSLVAAMFAATSNELTAELVASGVDALLTLGFIAVRPADVQPLLVRFVPSTRAALESLGVAVGFVVILTLYFRAFVALGAPLVRITPEYLEAEWPLWRILVVVSVCPALFEELAFRGVIQSGLERILSSRDAWIVQAALFSVLHLSPLIFVSHFFMGLVFGFLRNRNRSLYAGMLLHAGWNALCVWEEIPWAFPWSG